MGLAFGQNHSKGNTASVYDSTCQPDSLCVCLARNTSSQLLLPFLNMNSLTKRLKAITRVYMRVTTMRTKKTVKMNYNCVQYCLSAKIPVECIISVIKVLNMLRLRDPCAWIRAPYT